MANEDGGTRTCSIADAFSLSQRDFSGPYLTDLRPGETESDMLYRVLGDPCIGVVMPMRDDMEDFIKALRGQYEGEK